MIEYMEKIGSAVSTIIDAQISKANREKELQLRPIEKEIDQLDRQIELLEREEEEKTDAIDKEIKKKNKLIDSYQKQIDKMDKINEAKEREINLQKAMYEMETAQNQKTKLVYDKENGFTYQSDGDAITEARENLEDAKYEEEKAKIQDIIDKLNEEVDTLEDEKEAIEDLYDAQIKALEKQKEALEDQKYAIEQYWEPIIEALEDKKEKWEELMNVKEIADAYKTLEQAGVEMGFTVEDILNDTGGAFEAFSQMYVNLLSDAGYSSEQLKNAYGSFADIEIPTGNLESYVASTEGYFDEVKKIIAGYSTTLDKTADATKDVTGALSTAFDAAAGSAQNLSNVLSGTGTSTPSTSSTTSASTTTTGTTTTGTPSTTEGSTIGGDSITESLESIGTTAKEQVAETAVDAMSDLQEKGEETTTALIGDDESGFTGVNTQTQEGIDLIGDESADGTLISGINALGGSSSALDPLNEAASTLAGSLKDANDALLSIISNLGQTKTGTDLFAEVTKGTSLGGTNTDFTGQNNNPARAWGQNNQIPHGNNTDKTLVGKYLLTLNLFNCWETLRDNLTTT